MAVLSDRHFWREGYDKAVVRASIFGNVGSIISLRVGPDDAPVMAKALGREIEEDLRDLPIGQAWAQVTVNGAPYDAVKVRIPLLPRPTGHLASARRNTIASYARPAAWQPKALRNRYRQEEQGTFRRRGA